MGEILCSKHSVNKLEVRCKLSCMFSLQIDRFWKSSDQDKNSCIGGKFPVLFWPPNIFIPLPREITANNAI